MLLPRIGLVKLGGWPLLRQTFILVVFSIIFGNRRKHMFCLMPCLKVSKAIYVDVRCMTLETSMCAGRLARSTMMPNVSAVLISRLSRLSCLMTVGVLSLSIHVA